MKTYSIDESCLFVVECYASEVAISAMLNQGKRVTVAFMSRTLQGSELHYPSVEKGATAIIEAVHRWRHLLAGRHFILITDQRSVAFMLDKRKRSKLMNNKIQDWRLELASFCYTIKYRPGKDNVVPDSFAQAFLSSIPTPDLDDIHKALCHPGVTRMLQFVQSKNLPYSTEDVKRTCSGCRICTELKPQFYRLTSGTLIKATQPMERLSMDFKGLLLSASRNTYILTIVDEFSCSPFAFLCSNINSITVIKCLNQLAIYSLCLSKYVHSDRSLSFLSQEVKNYLTQRHHWRLFILH